MAAKKSDYFDPYRLLFTRKSERPNAGDGIRSFNMPLLPVSRSSFTFITLISDVHAESSAANIDEVVAELERARTLEKNGAHSRILLNGDVLDLIMPSDMKRYTPSVHAEDIAGKDNIINRTLDYASRIFKPYADMIDVVGMGNHEMSFLKHHNFDLTEELAKRLSTDKHEVRYARYVWYVTYKFERGGASGARSRFSILAHHGKSRAPKTRGMLEFRSMSEQFRDANVIWLGHNHFRNQDEDVEVGLDHFGNIRFDKVQFVRTGSYTNYTQDGYAAKFGLTPQPHGGALVALYHQDNDYQFKVVC